MTGGGGENEVPREVPTSVNSGGVAEFRCYASGDPEPYFTWVLADGSSLPTANEVLGERGNVLQLSDVTERTCVRCIAINSQGNTSAEQCVNVVSKCHSYSTDTCSHTCAYTVYSFLSGCSAETCLYYLEYKPRQVHTTQGL